MFDMKASNAAPTLPIPNPEDWCTIAYAAERLNRSERTVRRMGAQKVLRIYSPRVATNRERSDMCWVPEVEQLREALMRSGKLLAKTGWKRGEPRGGRGHRPTAEVRDEVAESRVPAAITKGVRQTLTLSTPSHMAVRAGLAITPQEGTAR